MHVSKELQELFTRYEEMFSDFSGVHITNVNQVGMGGEDNILHLAAYHSGTADVELLLKSGANVNAKGDLGRTAIHFAAENGKINNVNILLHYGANFNIKDEFGETPLDLAKKNNYDEIAKVLKRRSKGNLY